MHDSEIREERTKVLDEAAQFLERMRDYPYALPLSDDAKSILTMGANGIRDLGALERKE